MSEQIHKMVLFDFFEGKATTLQRKMIEEWLADADNEAFFYQCLDEWESQHPQYLPETDRALEQFSSLLNKPDTAPTAESAVTTAPVRFRQRWLRWSVAASVLLLVSTGLYIFQKNIRYQIYQTGNAQTESFQLADGTRITLNANSTLYVPRWGFDGTQRAVLLEGEAEFKVTHTVDHKRFVVKTNDDFNVEVLGTEFVVFARERGKKVVLNDGKVQIHYQMGKQLTLRPGDVLTLDANTANPQLTQSTQPEKHNAWKNHQFYFDNTPLSEVGKIIEEQFGLQVVIPDSTLANRRLAGYFKATTSQEILDVLSTLLDMPIEKREIKCLFNQIDATQSSLHIKILYS